MKKIAGPFLATSALVVSLFSAQGASASESQDEIAGYTKQEFVNAAAASGVPVDEADLAWGDRTAMSSIPVSTHTYSDNAAVLAPIGALAYVTHTRTCFKENRNIFNAILYRLSVTKKWQTDQNLGSVRHISAIVNTIADVGWSFGGIVNSWDQYGSGTHTSLRSGNFTNFFPDAHTTTVTVKARGNMNGTISCS